ncbi:alpha/beta hydrolase fold domain-containing protein [Hymenobacter lucidus]|uniref:Alpha/beta hydrolase fold domain-containing protein n=1 Tax=Hymenobacter lucidus TaxID=2880930 RepID=A0ABS8AL48_9BACT|nr:alpha/beta hydrolase fold domain-containing protein [Hymenobacter lucidus]MCB2406925.1 alpha/beta hydrolase fold domain-containing protein [Hymenobacter lucidus]
MKRLFLALLLLSSVLTMPLARAQALIDTTRGRYHQPIFPAITTRTDVVFGSATTYSGSTQTLRMNIYEPTGDTVRRRPLLVFAHGGGFVSGSKTDQDVTELCQRYARLGYVTASIDYRVLFFPFDTVNIARAAIRATQDMRAAVRFFRQDAATSKTYRIHPGYIFASGSSAGAFMALQLAYLNKDSEVPAYLEIAQLGGLEGNSGNPGYSSAVRGVVNLCGALGRPNWVEPGDIPLVSMHGTADGTVPYGKGTVGSGLPAQLVYGSGAIKLRADAVGVSNPLYTFKGAGHVPYSGTTARAQAYMDTTFRYVRDFLRPVLRQPGTITGTRPAAELTALQLYPLPATEAVQLTAAAGTTFQPRTLELLDATGRVVRRFRWEQREQQVRREQLKPGIYLLRGAGMATQRIVFE